MPEAHPASQQASQPASSHLPVFSPISMLAPSMVPMMKEPLSANFMLEVPEASVPAVEMCWLSSAAGMMTSASETL